MTVEIDVLTSPFSVSSSLVIEVAVRCVHQLLGVFSKSTIDTNLTHCAEQLVGPCSAHVA